MATICNFIICDTTQVIPTPDGQGTATLIINPQPILLPTYIPGSLSFSISFGVADLTINDIRCMELKFLAPNGQEKAQIKLDKVSDAPAGVYPTYNVELRNVDFPEEGTYSVQIRINDIDAATYPVLARRRTI